MLEMMIGSRKTTPPRMLRIVPFGERHIFFSPNSSTRCLVGRDRGALDADAVLLGRLGGVDRHLVVGGVTVLDRQVEVLQVDVEVGQDQLVLDEGPDDARHLVAVHLDDGVGHLDLGHGPGGYAAVAAVTSPPMDFDWTPEQQALRQQAREVAADAVARFGRHNDSWINGYSNEFAKEMAALGWIGLTWPTEHGGGGRPPIDRLIIGEELIAAGAPIAAMWFADRQMGPTLIAFGREDQQAAVPARHPRRRDDVVHRDVRARGRQRPRRAAHAGPPRRRRVGHQRAEDLDQLRRRRRLLYLICRTSTDGPPHQGISEIIVPMSTRRASRSGRSPT